MFLLDYGDVFPADSHFHILPGEHVSDHRPDILILGIDAHLPGKVQPVGFHDNRVAGSLLDFGNRLADRHRTQTEAYILRIQHGRCKQHA